LNHVAEEVRIGHFRRICSFIPFPRDTFLGAHVASRFEFRLWHSKLYDIFMRWERDISVGKKAKAQQSADRGWNMKK
jgi:hypothetical protein